MAQRKRRFVLRWSLQTLFLVTAVVAVWVAVFHYRQQNARLEREVASMRQMAREFVVEDEEQIAIVMLPQMWFDESRWKIHLPKGDYVMRLATRQVAEKGLAPVVDETPISSGRHEIELLQSDQGDCRKIMVTVGEQPLIEVVERPDWHPGHGSLGGSEFGACTQLSPGKPVVLFRRRFTRPSKTGQSPTPKGPTEGLMLWIEPVASPDKAGRGIPQEHDGTMGSS